MNRINTPNTPSMPPDNIQTNDTPKVIEGVKDRANETLQNNQESSKMDALYFTDPENIRYDLEALVKAVGVENIGELNTKNME